MFFMIQLVNFFFFFLFVCRNWILIITNGAIFLYVGEFFFHIFMSCNIFTIYRVKCKMICGVYGLSRTVAEPGILSSGGNIYI